MPPENNYIPGMEWINQYMWLANLF
jgi:hypothetical protein